jgi:hypothetical protein
MNSPRSLSAFLRARIGEDETPALDARRWYRGAGRFQADTTGQGAQSGPVTESFAAFVLAHEPDRVLNECIARRKIITLVTSRTWTGSSTDRDSVLRLLALPYVGHPAFRDEWRESS